jgi:type II secretory pathway pseudopilin PulG
MRLRRSLVDRRSGPCCASAGAFTLLEIIGVLAVLVIVITAVATVSLKYLDRLVTEQEAAQLKSMAQAYQDSVQQNRSIPGVSGVSNWVAAIASQMGIDPVSVATNGRKNGRVFLVDPLCQIGTNGSTVPYLQTVAGSVITNSTNFVIAPISPRVLIVSSLGKKLPTSYATNDFDSIWNAAANTVPTGPAWTGWGGAGTDLIVQRINLSSLFVRLSLGNYGGTNAGQYQIDSSAIITVTPAAVNAYYIRNTVLQLYKEGTNGPDVRQILTSDNSFVYSGGSWHKGLGQAPFAVPPFEDTEVKLIAATADQFLTAPWNSNATSGTRQTNVLNTWVAYMQAFTAWANSSTNPPKSGTLYNNCKAAQAVLAATMQNLGSGVVPGACQ